MEAELLEKKIEEADRLLSQLRALSLPITEMLFAIVARMGRWDSQLPRLDSHRLAEDLEKQLGIIGVPVKAIADAKKDWHKFNVIDLARPVCLAAHKQITEKINKLNGELPWRPPQTPPP